MFSKFRLPLLALIGIAIAAGILLGLVLPEPVVRVFATFNGLFGSFLGFIIPLLIIGLITPAIATLGRGAGTLLAITAGIAYLSTILAGALSWGTSMALFPTLLSGAQVDKLADPESGLAAAYFTVEVEPMFGVMSALVFSFVVGVTLTMIDAPVLQQSFVDFRKVIEKVIAGVIIPFLPLYIFGIFLNLTFAGQVIAVVTSFFAVVIVVIVLTFLYLLIQYGVAGAVSRRNPLRMLRTMAPAYATALGTSSSAATIPVTLRQAERMGIRPEIASFTVPLCATIHLAGSTIKITGFALAIMIMFGMPTPPLLIVGFILMLGITMVAAPGVPGGAIMTAAGLLSSMLGFSDAQVGLMIASYIAIDSVGTATNVTGDGAISAIVDKIAQRRLMPTPEDAAMIAELAE